jgi:CheY-like chemotaxis protein
MLSGKEGHVQNVPASILLVDDNADLLDLLSRTLTHLGHFNVLQAENGERGLEQAVAAHPDCIVVDIMMPGLDGYQLLRALRGDPDTADIPIVVLTALAQDHNRLAGYLVGADRYLVKPVKPQELIKNIEESIATRGEERAERLRTLAEGGDGDVR